LQYKTARSLEFRAILAKARAKTEQQNHIKLDQEVVAVPVSPVARKPPVSNGNPMNDKTSTSHQFVERLAQSASAGVDRTGQANKHNSQDRTRENDARLKRQREYEDQLKVIDNSFASFTTMSDSDDDDNDQNKGTLGRMLKQKRKEMIRK